MNKIGNNTVGLKEASALKWLDLSFNQIGALHNISLPRTLDTL